MFRSLLETFNAFLLLFYLIGRSVFQVHECDGATFCLCVVVKLEQVNEFLYFSKTRVGLSETPL